MHWFFYYLIPLFAAWKKRKEELAGVFYALCGTMLATFLAVWCEETVQKALLQLLPPEKLFKEWAAPVSLLAVWIIVAAVFSHVVEKAAPESTSVFIFPEKVTKFLVPALVFLHWGLICAMLFVLFAVSPLARYAPFIAQEESMCSAARYRMLWSSFFIDRFSFQESGVTARRRAFDRFVPENPGRDAKTAPGPRENAGKEK